MHKYLQNAKREIFWLLTNINQKIKLSNFIVGGKNPEVLFSFLNFLFFFFQVTLHFSSHLHWGFNLICTWPLAYLLNAATCMHYVWLQCIIWDLHTTLCVFLLYIEKLYIEMDFFIFLAHTPSMLMCCSDPATKNIHSIFNQYKVNKS